MTTKTTVYRRKLTPSEAKEKFILITKDRWSFFPLPGQTFDLRLGAEVFQVAVKAIPCQCVGTPHEHYHLPLEELSPLLEFAPGNVLVVQREDAGQYIIAPA